MLFSIISSMPSVYLTQEMSKLTYTTTHNVTTLRTSPKLFSNHFEIYVKSSRIMIHRK